MDALSIRPHDLVWLKAAAPLELDGQWPGWLTPDWRACAPLVVRRESSAAGRAPVGLRGATRSERCKGYAAQADIARRVVPEMLAGGARHLPCHAPALAALAALAPALDALGLAWGPTGGVGFFLASGLPVLRADSDLDLLVRAPQPLTAAQDAALGALQRGAACRIDIQIDTGHGAFAFAEWQRTAGRVLLKTDSGPVLSGDPWRALA